MENQNSQRPLLLDVRQAAYQLGVSPFTIRNWFYKKLIRGTKLGTRVLFPFSELERIANEGISQNHIEKIASEKGFSKFAEGRG